MRPKHVAIMALPPLLGHKGGATKVYASVDVVVDCLLLAVAAKKLAAPRLRHDEEGRSGKGAAERGKEKGVQG